MSSTFCGKKKISAEGELIEVKDFAQTKGESCMKYSFELGRTYGSISSNYQVSLLLKMYKTLKIFFCNLFVLVFILP